MLRQLCSRAGTLALFLAVLGLATMTTSCGGGGAGPNDMAIVQFLFMDRTLNPVSPTGTADLARNTIIALIFTETVSPNSVTEQTIRLRYGPQGQSVPPGSFAFDSNVVRFDPTITAQGQPNPEGFDASTQYQMTIPSIAQETNVVENTAGDPNLVTFATVFQTGEGYLRELVQPEIVDIEFVPPANLDTGQIPGDGVMKLIFSEAMDPATFLLLGPGDPNAGSNIFGTVDVRYVDQAVAPINFPSVTDGLGNGLPITGYFTRNAAMTQYIFNPTFSFGDNNYQFRVTVRNGLRDLAGNALRNPKSFPGTAPAYVCDGNGSEIGFELTETFDNTTNADFAPDPETSQPRTTAQWSAPEAGVLQGSDLTPEMRGIFGYQQVGTPGSLADCQTGHSGMYIISVACFAGEALNNQGIPINPPTALGRRVLWAFSDEEMSDAGTIVSAGWGPESNATFAANYPNVVLRAGFQKSAQMSLSPSISGNYDGSPTVLYNGSYQVPQAANVGNLPGHPTIPHTDPSIYPYPQNCQWWVYTPCAGDQLAPLFNFVGFEPWPDFTTYFDWNDGDPLVNGDKVFLFDASVDEGDTWQTLRGWLAMTFPCSGFKIPGYPNRRLLSTYEEDSPNPGGSANAPNPGPDMNDTLFTVVQRKSTAQILFYTDGFQPSNSLLPTFGAQTNYLQPIISPQSQPGGASVFIEYRGCTAVQPGRREPANVGTIVDWTTNINDCDGLACVQWRMTLTSNLISNTVARVTSVSLPIVQMSP